MRLVSGCFLLESDRVGVELVVVVNEVFVWENWFGEEVIGCCFRVFIEGYLWFCVVGVVVDVCDFDLQFEG